MGQLRHIKGAAAGQGGRFRGDPKPADVINLAAARAEKQLDGAFEVFRNIAGQPLSDESRARVVALLEHPTRETWDEGRSVTIGGRTTVWQALLAHTDFDTRVAGTDELVEEGFYPFRAPVYRHTPKGDVPTSQQVRAALLAVADDLRSAEDDTPGQ